MARPSIYNRWASMIQRTTNPNDRLYHRYGGRGITVCPEWMKFDGFAKWAYTNGYDPSLSLDRIDNDKGYCPENCQWITFSENAGKDKVKFEAFGKKQGLKAWAAEYNMPHATLRNRIYQQKMSLEKALTTPLGRTTKTPPLEAFGKAQSVRAWAREYDISVSGLRKRLASGMPLEKALTTGKIPRGGLKNAYH